MALVTYLTRISGLWLMSHVTLSTRMKAWLGYLPGTVIVAIVAPTVFSTGLAEAGAALATVLVMARTRNVLLTMIIGVSVVWGLRML
jgi:branched chain amino acid efflux pump